MAFEVKINQRFLLIFSTTKILKTISRDLEIRFAREIVYKPQIVMRILKHWSKLYKLKPLESDKGLFDNHSVKKFD